MGVTGVQTLMIAGGGTGGHIYPAIAIAREYVARDASRKVVFVGTQKGLEKEIVPKAGFPLEFIDVGGLKVNPLEVEQAMCEHPAVGACVVVPMRVSETVSRAPQSFSNNV